MFALGHSPVPTDSAIMGVTLVFRVFQNAPIPVESDLEKILAVIRGL